jgi:hypothetical protein
MIHSLPLKKDFSFRSLATDAKTCPITPFSGILTNEDKYLPEILLFLFSFWHQKLFITSFPAATTNASCTVKVAVAIHRG